MINPQNLHEELRPLYNAFLEETKARGLSIFVVATWRSQSDQLNLYCKGRTTGGKIVTNDTPESSLLCFTDSEGRPASLAFEFLPLVRNKPVLKYSSDVDKALWNYVGAIAKECDLVWSKKRYWEARVPTWHSHVQNNRLGLPPTTLPGNK